MKVLQGQNAHPKVLTPKGATPKSATEDFGPYSPTLTRTRRGAVTQSTMLSKRKSKPPKPVVDDLPRGKEGGDHSFSVSLFSSCSALLEKLMSHRHGWLFNAPVDVLKLRLKDYYSVIRQPMDLGTVKCRLEKGRYKSLLEFASDVRLTCRNAMTYNQRDDTAYGMAEELLGIFESEWPSIQSKFCDGNSDKEIDLGTKQGSGCKVEVVEEEWNTNPSKMARKGSSSDHGVESTE